MFELRVVFDTLDELQEFLDGRQEKECIIDKIKKLDDKRGQGTKAFHEKAKKYRTEHPNKTYRECLKELSELNKNNINNNI
jgi:rRNA-processing protein FCF1